MVSESFTLHTLNFEKHYFKYLMIVSLSFFRIFFIISSCPFQFFCQMISDGVGFGDSTFGDR